MLDCLRKALLQVQMAQSLKARSEFIAGDLVSIARTLATCIEETECKDAS